MLRYFKYLVFYFLALVDAFINFLASLVSAYPRSDIGTSFLIRRELGRIGCALDFREKDRSDKLAEANDKVRTAKSIFKYE